MQNYSPRTIETYRSNNLLMCIFIEKEFDIINIENIEIVNIINFISNFFRRIRERFLILIELSSTLEISSSMKCINKM